MLKRWRTMHSSLQLPNFFFKTRPALLNIYGQIKPSPREVMVIRQRDAIVCSQTSGLFLARVPLLDQGGRPSPTRKWFHLLTKTWFSISKSLIAKIVFEEMSPRRIQKLGRDPNVYSLPDWPSFS